MPFRFRPHAFLRLLVLLLAPWVPAVAHDHFPAGFVDSNNNGSPDPGEPLQFVERLIAPDPQPEERVFHLRPRPLGHWPAQRCGGYYGLDERPRSLPDDSFSCIVLSNGDNDDPQPETPHTGAWVWMEFVSVSGPPGANFGFWDENWYAFKQSPSVSFATNAPTTAIPDPGKRFFVLGEGGNFASADPYGHIHQRAWTATRPGTYKVTFRLVDRSTTNGGGPWHSPSRNYTFTFEAGPDFQPTGASDGTGHFVLTWPSLMGISNELGQSGIPFHVERSTSLVPGDWQVIGNVTGTTNATATFTDTAPPADRAFYRLRYEWAEP